MSMFILLVRSIEYVTPHQQSLSKPAAQSLSIVIISSYRYDCFLPQARQSTNTLQAMKRTPQTLSA